MHSKQKKDTPRKPNSYRQCIGGNEKALCFKETMFELFSDLSTLDMTAAKIVKYKRDEVNTLVL